MKVTLTARELLKELHELPEEALDLPIYIGNYANSCIPISYIQVEEAKDFNPPDLEDGEEYVVIQQI